MRSMRIDLTQVMTDALTPIVFELVDQLDELDEDGQGDAIASAITRAYELGARRSVAEFSAGLIERGIVDIHLDFVDLSAGEQ